MLFSFFACSSTRKIWQKDEIRNTLDTDKPFHLYTYNSKTYFFNTSSQYQISNDTIIGKGQVVADDSLGSIEDVRISIDKILKIELEEFDGEKTAILVVSIVGTGFLIYHFLKNATESMIM